jgi:glycosyltransferase involved in cell wall biosynthesis
MASEAGGPPVVAAGLAGALAARGHQLTIATVHGVNPAGERERQIPVPHGVALQSFPMDGSPRYAKSAALDAWLNANVRNFDIAHLHAVWQFPTFSAARACWRNRVPYVTFLHGMLDNYSVRQRSYIVKRAYWLWREGKIHSRAAAIHCLNKAEIRRAVPWIASFPKFVVGNGISRGELNSLPAAGGFRAAHPELAGKSIALFLSRIHPKKGLDRLIPTWKTLAATMSNAVLVIAGAGDAEYVATIDQLIVQNGLQKNVVRVGQLTGEKKWQALVDADIFVLPSHQEGFSMAITEALAASLPPVVTEECNFDELEEAKAGIIIKNGDMQAFVDACQNLLMDLEKRKSFGARGRLLVESDFTWDQIAQRVEDAYRNILAGKPAADSSVK